MEPADTPQGPPNDVPNVQPVASQPYYPSANAAENNSPPQPVVAPSPAYQNVTPVMPTQPSITPTQPPMPPQPLQSIQQPLSQPEVYSPYPVSGVVVGGEDPASPAESVSAPTVTASSPQSSHKGSKKRFIIAAAAVIVLIGGGLGFYFGYWMNSSVILSQSLSNSGKGYEKLVNYFDQQSQVHYKGGTANGTFAYKGGGTSTDGSLSYKDYGANSDTNFNVGLGVTRAQAEVRTIKAPTGKSPDVYLKVSGLKGLGGLTGDAKFDATLNKLDGQWIVVDHSLFDSITAPVQHAQSQTPMPNRQQILSEIHAFNSVSKQYVFTTNKNKSVTTVTHKYGVENVGGHRAYHYKMALDKAHVKDYITAQRDALKASQLGAWLKQHNYGSDIDSSYKNLEQSADSISNKDTFDLWSDTSTRMVYKLRFGDSTNAATNYLDVGLDYKGGPSYPFFISGQDKSSGTTDSGSMVVTLNSKTNSVGLKITGQSGGSGGANIKADVSFQPSNTPVTVQTPAGAIQLSQALDELGLGSLLSNLTQSANSLGGSLASGPGLLGTLLGGASGINGGIQSKATDTKRQTDIQSLQTQLEAYYSQNGNYPTFSELNSVSWRKTNMPSIDDNALMDPGGNTTNLVTKTSAKSYAYQVTNAAGASCEASAVTCAKYTLTAQLSDGNAYSKSQLN